MVFSDNIYENSGYILRNLNESATQDIGIWVAGTGYGFYGTHLEKPLTYEHLYYQRYTYKFTTTNQSPTWVNYYLYGGMQGGSGKNSGLIANTEYTISGIVTPNMGAGNSPYSMTIYNGNSGAISGVTSYVKDVLVYDVTELFSILKAKGVIENSTSSLQTWCDTYLKYVKTGIDYDISESVVILPSGYQQLEYLEATGTQYINTQIRQIEAPFRVIADYYRNDSGTSDMCIFGERNLGKFVNTYNTYYETIFGNTSSNTLIKLEKAHIETNSNSGIILNYNNIFSSSTSSNRVGSQDTPMFAFTESDSFSPKWFFKGKIYYLQIHEKGKVTHFFIPAKRISDSILGMYDIPTNTFYINSGSGTFIGGPVVCTFNTNKASFTKGFVSCNEVIEPDSMTKYSCNSTLAAYTFFDTGSGIYVYNNNGNGTVTHTRVAASTQNSPFTYNHPYILKITTNGSASPYAGGFYTNHYSAANKVFIEKFVAKIPIGYEVTAHYNSQGSGASVYWITPTAGTGDWEEYAVLYRCGSSGSFSTGGHIALYGSNNTSVTWYVAYVNDCDITGNEDLMNYRVLPNKTSIKNGKIFTGEFNTVNLLTNGDCHVQDSASLPGGWYYDTSDYAGDARCSLVQPVGASAGIFGPMLPVDPMNIYKVSYWVKSNRSMSSFLTAICYYTSDGRGPWTHSDVNYYSGTKTTLSSALNNGDTQIAVASNSNWASRSYSRLGFRSSIYNVSYNNIGTSHGYNGSTGLIKGTSGSNVVTLNTAYSGSTIPAGTCVVESYDGGTYPYPIQKDKLPTDNTWKYVEGYFGAQGELWDGAGSWNAIPADMRYIRLYMNIYSNNGSVPIKYSDIRITPLYSENGRIEKKVSITC